MADFDGKVALVTGGGQGIGKATALALAGEGCTVVICGRTIASLERVEHEITQTGGQVIARTADISQEHEIKSLINDIVVQFGKLDIIVCNAGVRSNVPFFEVDDAEWYRVLDTNMKGTFYSCRAAMEHMKLQKSGRILTISSIAGVVGGTLANAPYSMAKAGIIVLTKVVAKMMAPFGVTANCIVPGTIDTPFIGDYDEEKRSQLQSLIPLDRLGTAEDIAAAVLYLASDQANWVTGVTLNVNGGQLIL